MRNIILYTLFLLGIFYLNLAVAQDDVYDAPVQKPMKVKSYKQQHNIASDERLGNSEQTQSYSEGDNPNTRMNVTNNNYYNNSSYGNDGYYSEDWNYGYTDRIRRFHNPSIQFSYGWNNWNNNFYSPWNSFNSWNSWDNYAFTPSWMYSYNNFYNPFWSGMYPSYGSWFNIGMYNPFSNWGFNNGWYGFSPYCYNTIYNYGYNNYYGGYYDYNKRNVVYTPRIGGYSNSTNAGISGYNSGNSGTNTNNTGGFTKGNTNQPQQQVAPTSKWNNRTINNNYSNPNPENVYRYNNSSPSYNNNSYNNRNNGGGGWDNSFKSEPNINIGTGGGGVKIGSRPK